MRKFMMSTAMTAAVLLLSASAAVGGPPGTFSLTEYGRAITASDASIVVPAGEVVAAETLDLPSNSSVAWTGSRTDRLVLVMAGTVAVSSACTGERRQWETGRAYHQPPGDVLVENDGGEPAHLVVVLLKAPDPRDQPVEGCPTGGRSVVTDRGRGRAVAASTIDIQAGKQMIVQLFVVEPSFNFFWHHHPPSIIVQLRGRVTAYLNCTDTEVWEPGYAYHHTPGHHHGQQTVKNEGDETAEMLAIFYNAPEWLPPPLFGRDVQPPYSDCPTRSLL